MEPVPEPWSLLSLTELIESFGDPDAEFDALGSLAVVARSVDAELAVICARGGLIGAVGFDGITRPDRQLLGIAESGARRAELAELGWVHLAAADMGDSGDTILVGRRDRPFTRDEFSVLATICRIVGMAATMRSALEAERQARATLERQVVDNRLLLAQLRERQGLLDRLFRIQQSISHRSPTQEVLDSVTTGALELLSASRVTLRLIDLEEPDTLVLVSSRGFDPADLDSMQAVRISTSCAGSAVEQCRLVVEPHVAEGGGPGAMMASPVSVGEEVVGCLTVSTIVEDRRFTAPEQEALIALAQHASLALQDARATDAMRSALQRERHRAEHDPLTGLPNRATIRAALSHRIGMSERFPVVLLFVDLDRFKLTNDTLGHGFGDTVLSTVADRLRRTVRDSDVVGRLSGDEFVVICEGMTEAGALEFAERLQTVISEPIIDGHLDHVITASVGIARVHRGDSAEQVLANADLAMYRAKQSGRARVEVFDEELRDRVEERLLVSQDLRHALARDELKVYLQPVVELPTRRVTGFEALVRWDHPTRGKLLPDSFIPIAEETGQIPLIDRLVLGQVIRLLGEHPAARPIAANVSARTFSDPTLVPWIRDHLADAGVDASRLVIEVTETVLMDVSGIGTRQIRAMRDLGVAIMLDDFGTGYSSLAYLQSFDVDGVKIDRAFVARIGTDPRADVIIGAVFSMAAALDLVVVAEGVETDEQMGHMVELRDRNGGAELHGQGYLFGKAAEGRSRLAGFVEVLVPQPVGRP